MLESLEHHQRAASSRRVSCENQGQDLGCQVPEGRRPLFLRTISLIYLLLQFEFRCLGWSSSLTAIVQTLGDRIRGTEVALVDRWPDLDRSTFESQRCHLTHCVPWGWCLNFSELVSLPINGTSNTHFAGLL